MCPENSCPSSLWKFTALVVQVFCCGYMMEESPALSGSNKTGWENDSVERNIIFTHELIQFYILVDPPFFVFLLKEIGSDRYVSDWGIEPYIKYLIFKFFNWHSNSPFQVSRNALWFKS
jgi:hypothetical protein